MIGATLTYTGIGTVVIDAGQAGNAQNQSAAAIQDAVTTIGLVEPVGTSSPVITTTVILATLGSIGAINVLTQGAPNLDITFAPGGTCAAGTAYVAGQTCTVNFVFTPRLPGITTVASINTRPQQRYLQTASSTAPATPSQLPSRVAEYRADWIPGRPVGPVAPTPGLCRTASGCRSRVGAAART